MLKLYLDTSVWGFLIERQQIEKKKITEDFFKQSKQQGWRIFISPLVLDEVNRFRDLELKNNIERFIKDYTPELLPYDEEIGNMTDRLAAFNIIPTDYLDDIRHLAFAVFYEMDAIVSWNMKHMVNLRTKRAVAGVCSLIGVKEVNVLTPEEVC
ncbi:MAG: hypothetical protein AAB038_03140 [Planctomycetota bacterium]